MLEYWAKTANCVTVQILGTGKSTAFFFFFLIWRNAWLQNIVAALLNYRKHEGKFCYAEKSFRSFRAAVLSEKEEEVRTVSFAGMLCMQESTESSVIPGSSLCDSSGGMQSSQI